MTPEEEEVSDLIVRAITAAGAKNSARAGDLTVRLVYRRPMTEVYGAFCGVAQFTVNAVEALNSDDKAPGPPGGGPWTLDHLVTPPAVDESADSSGVFVREFLATYDRHGADGNPTINSFNALAEGGVAYVVFYLAHLIKEAAEVTGRALSHHLGPVGGWAE